MKKIAILVLLTFGTLLSFGQQKWELGLMAGSANYLGDLVEPSFTLNHGSFAGGALVRYSLLENINLKGNLLVGKLVGDDANYSLNATRMASFKNNFVEVSVMGEYDVHEFKSLFKENKKKKKRRRGKKKMDLAERIWPYGFIGLGMALTNLSTEFGSSSEDIIADINEDYSDIQPVVPIGLGFKFLATEDITLSAEMGMRLAFTDYLDGVSQSGNPSDNDAYVWWGLTATHVFQGLDIDQDGVANAKDKCPELPGPARLGGCPDSDNDGVTDDKDECPNDAGKALLAGCPDSDNDGVSDFVDDCPDQKGIRRLGGCPDTDNDGIVDPEDICPNKPGIPSLNGCPDADRDGITDSNDECPLEPGAFHQNGCPDSDEDGIVDKDDKCPKERGKAANNGCPDEDTDGDGLVDRKDKCPETAGPADNAGCPIIKKEDQKVLDFAMANVEFETGSDKLTPASKLILEQIADIMFRYKGYHLQINGHTDNVGEDDKNMRLSENRAMACFNYLFVLGINPTVMTSTGYGRTQPIADNETEEGRRENRRVEFILTTKGN